jgi:hypothetical protein
VSPLLDSRKHKQNQQVTNPAENSLPAGLRENAQTGAELNELIRAWPRLPATQRRTLLGLCGGSDAGTQSEAAFPSTEIRCASRTKSFLSIGVVK